MNRLRQAAEAGDIYELYDVILEEEDAELVDTPLHIAANKGHADFANAMMYLKPSLGRKLNRNIYSPMHLAVQNGHREVVLDLLAADKDLVRVKGREGYTSLHYAAENGDIDLLAQFLKDCPACVEDVTIRKETALHLAVRNNKSEAVEILARFLQRTHIYCKVSKSHLLNSKDRNGNTPLHIAASNTQPKMIQVLIECRVSRKETNNQGFTALDLLEMQNSDTDNREMCLDIIRVQQRSSIVTRLKALGKAAAVYLKNASPKHIKEVIGQRKEKKKEVEPALSERLRSKITNNEASTMRLVGPIMKMSAGKINALLVVVTLILTTTYQAMLSPPGGVWQGEYPANTTSNSKHVGESIMHRPFFAIFFLLNFEVFVLTSLLVVVLLYAATKSSTVAVAFEILLSSVLWCISVAELVIFPKTSAEPVKIPLVGSQILLFLPCLGIFLLLHISRRRFCSNRRIRFFQEFFAQDM